jgi:hypothetical protein
MYASNTRVFIVFVPVGLISRNSLLSMAGMLSGGTMAVAVSALC